jgi:hypothetical protein
VLVRGAHLTAGEGAIVEDVVMDAASDMFR